VGQCEYFRKAADDHGRRYDPAKVGWLTHVHVADSDEQALEEFGAHAAYGGLLTRGFGGPAKTFYPPGHLPPDRLAKWERQVRESYTAKPMPGDPPLMGTPETVAERLISRLKDYKIGNVVMAFQWGTMPQEMVTRSMRLFAEEVMPIVRAEMDEYLDRLYPDRTQSDMANSVVAG